MGKTIFSHLEKKNYPNNGGMMEKRKDFELIATVPLGVEIKAMIEWRDHIYLATEKGVYVLEGKVFQPLQFEEVK